LGNLEEVDLGEGVYDVIIASSVFEHVEFWRVCLDKLYRAHVTGGCCRQGVKPAKQTQAEGRPDQDR
jgi:hypothetical protein